MDLVHRLGNYVLGNGGNVDFRLGDVEEGNNDDYVNRGRDRDHSSSDDEEDEEDEDNIDAAIGGGR